MVLLLFVFILFLLHYDFFGPDPQHSCHSSATISLPSMTLNFLTIVFYFFNILSRCNGSIIGWEKFSFFSSFQEKT